MLVSYSVAIVSGMVRFMGLLFCPVTLSSLLACLPRRFPWRQVGEIKKDIGKGTIINIKLGSEGPLGPVGPPGPEGPIGPVSGS